MNIGIYTTEDVLEHKKYGGQVYWELSHRVRAGGDDRIYFATKGRWQGYFKIDDVETYTNFANIDFNSSSWRELDDKPERKPFQGFTYKVPSNGGKK